MKIAIIGAGNGGKAIAAYMKKSGCHVNLYNRTKSVLDGIKQNNGINISGIYTGKYLPDLLTDSLTEAIDSADIIFYTLPADAHYDITINLSKNIKENQLIILNPGRTLGSLSVSKALTDGKCTFNINIAETDTFLFTCRAESDYSVKVFSKKREVLISSLHSNKILEIINKLSPFFDNLKPVKNTLETGLNNIGMILHPVPTLLNLSRIEDKQKYLHYKDGITPSIANFMEKMDAERVKIANAAGVDILSVNEWLKKVYGSNGNSLYEILQNTEAYKEVYAPTTIYTRYITEELLTGIVPYIALSRYLGINADILNSVLTLATNMLNYDFYENGRNHKKIDFDFIFKTNER